MHRVVSLTKVSIDRQSDACDLPDSFNHKRFPGSVREESLDNVSDGRRLVYFLIPRFQVVYSITAFCFRHWCHRVHRVPLLSKTMSHSAPVADHRQSSFFVRLILSEPNLRPTPLVC